MPAQVGVKGMSASSHKHASKSSGGMGKSVILKEISGITMGEGGD